eukprot:scaffold238795_cov20-Tisochrysis_lutea.AAC.2
MTLPVVCLTSHAGSSEVLELFTAYKMPILCFMLLADQDEDLDDVSDEEAVKAEKRRRRAAKETQQGQTVRMQQVCGNKSVLIVEQRCRAANEAPQGRAEGEQLLCCSHSVLIKEQVYRKGFAGTGCKSATNALQSLSS